MQAMFEQSIPLAFNKPSGQVELFSVCKQVVFRATTRCIFGPAIFEAGRFEEYTWLFDAINPDKGFMNLMRSNLVRLVRNQRALLFDGLRDVIRPIVDRYRNQCIEELRTAGLSQEANRDYKGFTWSLAECMLHARIQQALRDQIVANSDNSSELKLDSLAVDVFKMVLDLFAVAVGAISNSHVTAAWTIYHLAKHPHCYAKFWKQASELCVSDSPISYDQLQGLTYLRDTVYEVGRLFTTGGVPRVVLKPLQLTYKGFTVPVGQWISQSSKINHREPLFFPDPERFDPDRYSPERNEGKRAAFHFVPFGAGRHACIGERFGLMEIALLSCMLFRRFDLETVTQHYTLEKSQVLLIHRPTVAIYARYTVKK